MNKSAIATAFLIVAALSFYGAIQYQKFDGKRAEERQKAEIENKVKIANDLISDLYTGCLKQERGVGVAIFGTSTDKIQCLLQNATSTK